MCPQGPVVSGAWCVRALVVDVSCGVVAVGRGFGGERCDLWLQHPDTAGTCRTGPASGRLDDHCAACALRPDRQRSRPDAAPGSRELWHQGRDDVYPGLPGPIRVPGLDRSNLQDSRRRRLPECSVPVGWAWELQCFVGVGLRLSAARRVRPTKATDPVGGNGVNGTARTAARPRRCRSAAMSVRYRCSSADR